MSTVRWETDGPVAIVTIDRPEVRNAVDGPTADALADAFRRFDADDALAVAVLTGAGGTFCAGADLKARRPTGGGNRGRPRTATVRWARAACCSSKPVIAAVEGHAVAGGLELAVWCDLRVAARDAVFGVFCRRWGVPLIDGGTIRLAAADRAQPRPRPDPHRAGRLRRRGAAHGPRQPARRAGDGARRGGRAGARAGRASRSAACAATGCRRTSNGRSTCRPRCATRPRSASTSSPPARPSPAPSASRRARAGTVASTSDPDRSIRAGCLRGNCRRCPEHAARTRPR